MDPPYTPIASSYQTHPTFNPNTPPPPPPKHSNHAPTQLGTPEGGPPLPPPPPPPHDSRHPFPDLAPHQQNQQFHNNSGSSPVHIPPPEDGWLPSILKDKSKPDLTHILTHPALQTALINAPHTTHASLPTSQSPLHTALARNLALSHHLLSLEPQLATQRAKTQSQLLAQHALERQWRQKQTEMDAALAPFSPKALYQRLALAVAEQEGVCVALEESFLEGEGRAGEREVGEFLRRFREGRKLAVLRGERRERWDEGRVGGWR